MAEEATINFYRVNRCGYYKWGERRAEFGFLGDTLSALQQWVDGKHLDETCTYEIDEDADLLHTYCFNIIASGMTGNYVMTTWNEVPSAEGNFPSVNGSTEVGHAEVTLTEIPENNIPGYATYFWLLPARSLLATVRFGQRLTGTRGLTTLTADFLAKFAPFVVAGEPGYETDHAIVGYRPEPTGVIRTDVRPHFDIGPVRVPGQLEFLRENCPAIRKAVRKDALNSNIAEQSRFVERIFQNVGLLERQPQRFDMKVKFEFDFEPDLQQLNAIISSWESQHDTRWSDIGFKLRSSQEVYWLSHSLVKSKIPLDVERVNAEVVEEVSLLNALDQNIDQLLRQVTREE